MHNGEREQDTKARKGYIDSEDDINEEERQEQGEEEAAKRVR